MKSFFKEIYKLSWDFGLAATVLYGILVFGYSINYKSSALTVIRFAIVFADPYLHINMFYKVF